MRSRKLLKVCLGSLIVLASTKGAFATTKTEACNIQALINNAQGLKPHVLKVALDGYQWALNHGRIDNKRLLTVIDLTLPSNLNRLWVIDLKQSKIVMAMRVAHGKNSGFDRAQNFSNSPGSLKSSVGVFKTCSTYQGGHGLSLKIDGLEKGVNDKALSRAIVIHAASYMTQDFVNSHGYCGRSWGCPAVEPNKIKPLINLIKGGSVMFTYGRQGRSYASSNTSRPQLIG